ncbi:hypothetical protein BH10PLA2_BH10PLA2_06930 [soil metagenome]
MDDQDAKPGLLANPDPAVEGGIESSIVPGSKGEPSRVQPAFDPKQALQLLGDDEAFLAEIIALFLDDLPIRLEALNRALSSNDAPGVRREAHTIKGASSNLAAGEVCRTAEHLEAIGASGDLSSATQAHQELQQELDRLVNELRNFPQHPAD